MPNSIQYNNDPFGVDWSETIKYQRQLDGISGKKSIYDEEIDINFDQLGKKPLYIRVGEVVVRVIMFIRNHCSQLMPRLQRKSGECALYYFTQQYNDSCHLSPIMNLKILKKIKANGYQLGNVKAYSRRQWMGNNQKMLISWHSLISRLCIPEAEKQYPHLYGYLTKGAEQGPTLPHFYNEKGEIAFHGLKGLLEFGEMPFFFIDAHALEKVKFSVLCKDVKFGDLLDLEHVGLSTGIVKDKGEYKIYNRKTGEYESINDKSWITIDEESHKVVLHNPTADQREDYSLPDDKFEIVLIKDSGLGFEQIGTAKKLGGGFSINGEVYFPYRMSLLKLMLLAAGVDNENNAIEENHPLYHAYKELKELMSEDTNNLWNSNHLNKDMLLQYRIANMFKEDPDLFQAAKEMVDSSFGGAWKNYLNLKDGNYFDQNQHLISEERIQNYLLGEEQIVAYHMMHILRMAWYASVNPKAALKGLEADVPLPSGPFQKYIKRTLLKKHKLEKNNSLFKNQTISFLDVWDKLREKLIEDVPNEQDRDFVSFDSHGWVMSLDPKVIELQNQMKNLYDGAFVNRLGFAGIESWLSSELNLWYKTTNANPEDSSGTILDPANMV